MHPEVATRLAEDGNVAWAKFLRECDASGVGFSDVELRLARKLFACGFELGFGAGARAFHERFTELKESR